MLKLSLSFFLLLPLASFGYCDPGVTDHEILIGTCMGFTGIAKTLATRHLLGAQAAISYINERGGIHGRRLKLLDSDDQYDADEAIVCFNRLLREEIFVGAFFEGTIPATKHVLLAEANKVPIVGIYSGASFLRDPFKRYVFSVRDSYSDQTRDLVDHAWSELGARKIGILYQSDALGATMLEG